MREKCQGLQDLEPGGAADQDAGDQPRDQRRRSSRRPASSSSPSRSRRLHQISYQQRGLQAFSDPDVAKKLNLTDAQKTDIQEIAREAGEKRPSREDIQSDREAAMKKMQEINKETLAKAESKLNDEQQKTWKELLGAPFEIQYPPRNN